MDDYQDKTITQAFGAIDQTQLSTCSSKPNENSKPRPSAKIRGLVGRLGLRYHPASSADLQSHQAMLVLLAEDLAFVPEDLLEKAINRHVTSSPYMAKAADLIKLAKEIEDGGRGNVNRRGGSYSMDLAASYNEKRHRDDVEWVTNPDGSLRIQFTQLAEREIAQSIAHGRGA